VRDTSLQTKAMRRKMQVMNNMNSVMYKIIIVSKSKDGKDYSRESLGIARPAATLGRLGATASGLPRGMIILLIGEDGILRWQQSGGGFISGMVLCGLVLAPRFRLIETFFEEHSVSMQSFTFGRSCFWAMMNVCGMEDWFAGCCTPPGTTEGGQGNV
jgi:hypothetical protein